MSARLFTSESVTEGHPDKICDQISDSILDAMLAQDPGSRVAVETMVTTGLVHVAGEVTTEAYVEIPKIVRDTVLGIGYDSSTKGFDGASCGVEVSIGQQSPDIAQGVDTAYENRTGGVDPLDKQGAGDQGLMFGYACEDTAELMPLPIHLAHRLAERLTAVRKSGEVAYLRPDGKTQVTIGYDGDKAVRLDTVVLSTQHAEDISLDGLLAPDIIEHVIKPVLAELADEGTELDLSDYRTLINPTGNFVIGGPMGDAGLTGRKIIVDTYGGMSRHGGGAFSGKDPSKVDRSAAYAMRWVAKNVVAAGLARRCEVQVAYAIGKAQPVGLYVETFGTESVPVDKIQSAISTVFDLRPGALVQDLDLLRPIYKPTAAYGHFGRTDGRQGREPVHLGAHRPRRRAAEGRQGLTAPSARFAPVSGQEGETEQLELIRSTLPRTRTPRTEATASTDPVASVVVDTGLAHLDRPFEYLVPESLADTAVPGARVKVRFAGQDLDGFVVTRQAAAEHEGKLAPIRRVVSPEPVLTPTQLSVATAVAARCAGSLGDVLRHGRAPAARRRREGAGARGADA